MTLGGLRVVVAGLGVAGYASADGLIEAGAHVTVVDEADTPALRDKARVLEALGAVVRLGAGSADSLPDGTQALVVSPSWTPALVPTAETRGVPVWSDLDAAWQVAHALTPEPPPWLVVTGTQAPLVAALVASVFRAASLTAALVGHDRPVMEAVLDGLTYDALIVAATAGQLKWTGTISPHSAALVGLPAADDGKTLARVYHDVRAACVYDVDAPDGERLVEQADVVEGARAIGFTTGVPAPSMLGVVDGLLVDRAFIAQRRDSAIEVAKLADVGADRLTAALAAAALARSWGIGPLHVAAGLRDRPTRR